MRGVPAIQHRCPASSISWATLIGGRVSRRLAATMLATALLGLAGGGAFAATFTVTNSSDSGAGSLRQAIIDANVAAGTDAIEFAVGVTTVTLSSALPGITGTTIIDGTLNLPPGMYIDIDGATNAVTGVGLNVAAASCEFYGLYVHGFASHGISVGGTAAGTTIGATGKKNVLSGNGGSGISCTATNVTIAHNLIGLDTAGVLDMGNTVDGIVTSGTNTLIRENVISGNGDDGITASATGLQVHGNIIGLVANGTTAVPNAEDGIECIGAASGATIGTAAVADRNIISGNGTNPTHAGIRMGGANSTITNNYIGTDATGMLDGGGTGPGITVSAGAATNVIIRGNVVSGNGSHGIQSLGGSTAIHGNIIGLAMNGNTPLPNTGDGIVLSTSATNCSIGTAAVADRNIISGNTGGGGGGSIGIRVNPTGVSIVGNFIGTDSTGLLDRGNQQHGIFTTTNSGGTIRGNVISGNNNDGINLDGDNFQIHGNIIGLGADGTTAVGNGNRGVFMTTQSTGCQVGTGAPADRNCISSNGVIGVRFAGASNTVRGNYIGTSASGLLDRGNGGIGGVSIEGAGCSVIENLIAGNGQDGINISDTGAQIQGNTIGLAADGTALRNDQDGIELTATGTGAVIGGITAGEGNVISSNGASTSFHGIRSAAASTTIQNNRIGTDPSGLLGRGNAGHGVYVQGATATVRDNLISGNALCGVLAEGADADIHGNMIGLGADGSTPLLNGNNGIELSSTATGAEIGTGVPADRNIISANGTTNAFHGIRIAAANARVLGNYIGTDSAGLLDRGNTGRGIMLLAAGATIGDSGAGNVISGNGIQGITMFNAPDTTIQGNIIGIDVTGAVRIENGAAGISINDANCDNTLIGGGTDPGDRNIITGNALNQIYVEGSSVTIQGNRIGTNSDGTSGVANAASGIYVHPSAVEAILIGGTAAGEGNLISSNANGGIIVEGPMVSILGNWIGLAADGASALANGADGVLVTASGSATVIGSVTGSGGNTISGNGIGITHSGITIAGPGVTVENNRIGTTAAGTASVSNAGNGIILGGADGVIRGNVVSGNVLHGVSVTANGGLIEDNLIGLNVAGAGSLSNFGAGLAVADTASSLTIRGNHISGNFLDGVTFAGDNMQILSNVIGLALDGSTPIANGGDGIEVGEDSSGTIIGTALAGDRNVISGNLGNGIRSDGTGLSVVNNSIGTDTAGTLDLGNGENGVLLGDTATGDLDTVLIGNVIAHSVLDNINIGAAASGVEIAANSIDGDCRFPVSFNGALVANDALDADTGANNQQNHPEVAPTEDTFTDVTGDLSAEADTLYTIHLFSSTAAHSSGNGPGEIWEGSTTVMTNASGDGSWSITTGTFAAGDVLSAIAVAPNGDSSHFSPAVVVITVTSVPEWHLLND